MPSTINTPSPDDVRPSVDLTKDATGFISVLDLLCPKFECNVTSCAFFDGCEYLDDDCGNCQRCAICQHKKKCIPKKKNKVVVK